MSDHQNPDLLFAEQLQLSVSTGENTSTVRTGFRDYRPGPCRAWCHITKWEQPIHIVEVRFCEARSVEAEFLGHVSQEEFYEEMRSFGPKYADFGPDSEVTVLYFVLPEKLDAEREELDALNQIAIFSGLSGDEV